MLSIDLNADLGEGDPYDAELLQTVSSCNIACGGHAGDAESMRLTVATALENGVAIGAHPSYPDREGFGRRNNFLTGPELLDSLRVQVTDFAMIAGEEGATIAHVKPHGALYNDAVRNPELADIIARAIKDMAANVAMVGMADSVMQGAAERHSLTFFREGFVDRAYGNDGQLIPRTERGAVHESLDRILPQALALVGRVDTLCIHGDSPDAAETARAVRDALEKKGVTIHACGRR